MSRSKKFRTLTAAICMLIGVVGFAHAEHNLQADAVVGVSIPSTSGFDSTFALSASITYAHSSMRYRLGYLNLGDFTLENGSVNSRLEIDGYYLEILKVFALDWANMEIGAGLVATNTVLFFENEQLRDASDTSPFVEFVLSRKINELITLHAGVSWISDVSGSDITQPKTGIRFSF